MINVSNESVETRKKINGYINELVDAMVMQDGITEKVKSIKESAEEATGITKAELSKRAKLRYMRIYNSEKFEAEREFNEAAYDEDELLEQV